MVATAVLVVFLASGLSLADGGLDGAADRLARMTPSERVTYVPRVPLPLPLPPAPEPAAAPPPTSRSALVEPVPPRAPSAAPAPGRILAPPDSLGRDAGRGRTPPPLPVGGVAGRTSLPTLPAAPRDASERRVAAPCQAPCADVLTAGPLTGPAGLDSADRARRLRALGESVPVLARERGRRLAGEASAGPTDPGGPPVMGGVGLAVGLPGGGPTRAQRERDRKLHAQNMTMMARVRARVDPAVADSLARADSIVHADSLRADSLRADSLRADSLRADSLARTRSRPPS